MISFTALPFRRIVGIGIRGTTVMVR